MAKLNINGKVRDLQVEADTPGTAASHECLIAQASETVNESPANPDKTSRSSPWIPHGQLRSNAVSDGCQIPPSSFP